MKNQKNIRISDEADRAVDRMVEEVNNEFDGGSVNRTELLSLIVLRFEKHLFKKSIPIIRKIHFDQLAYLESLVLKMKRAKSNGDPLNNISELLGKAYAKNDIKMKKVEANEEDPNKLPSSPFRSGRSL